MTHNANKYYFYFSVMSGALNIPEQVDVLPESGHTALFLKLQGKGRGKKGCVPVRRAWPELSD